MPSPAMISTSDTMTIVIIVTPARNFPLMIASL